MLRSLHKYLSFQHCVDEVTKTRPKGLILPPLIIKKTFSKFTKISMIVQKSEDHEMLYQLVQFMLHVTLKEMTARTKVMSNW